MDDGALPCVVGLLVPLLGLAVSQRRLGERLGETSGYSPAGTAGDNVTTGLVDGE